MSRQLILILILLILGGVAAYVYWPNTNAGRPPGPPLPDAVFRDLKGDKKGLRVLFVGNSHTATNNLPELVTNLAKAAGVERPLLAFAESPGGTSFQMHWNKGRVQQLLGEVKWDLVVLQDESKMPYYSREERAQQTVPFARKLHDKVTESGARTVLFMTWGYNDNFLAMQKLAHNAYQDMATELKCDLAPVGLAWEKAHKVRPELALWTGDGNHAAMNGTYLAACVFFAVFYGQSPVGNSFHAGLEPADARFLQEMAAGVVELRPGGLAAKSPGRNQ